MSATVHIIFYKYNYRGAASIRSHQMPSLKENLNWHLDVTLALLYGLNFIEWLKEEGASQQARLLLSSQLDCCFYPSHFIIVHYNKFKEKIHKRCIAAVFQLKKLQFKKIFLIRDNRIMYSSNITKLYSLDW